MVCASLALDLDTIKMCHFAFPFRGGRQTENVKAPHNIDPEQKGLPP